MFSMLRRWRRRRLLARKTIADPIWSEVIGALPALSVLGTDARQRLRDLALIFLEEKSVHGARGLVLDDAMRLRIALLACRPVLELGIDCYRGFVSIVVHPDEFVARDREFIDDDGIVHVGDEIMSGEAWDRGPIVLAWREVLASGRGQGFDVIAHEAAHKLDLLDGAVNGRPPLHSGMSADAWAEVFQQAFDDLAARDARGEDTWLDPYAGENPGEFFAVCSEVFFDVPDELRKRYPAVYSQLAGFYKQDPGINSNG